jgi:short-subunit dehydrogenase
MCAPTVYNRGNPTRARQRNSLMTPQPTPAAHIPPADAARTAHTGAARVVFITGASSGIGAAAAVAFARAGWHVAGTARRADRLAETAAQVAALPAGHGEFLALAADVTDADAIAQAVAETVARFGRLDCAIANAGVGHRGGVADARWADTETLLRTNIDGVLFTVRAAVPALRAGGGGHLILISSVVFNMTTPYAALYSASKAFVSSIARALRYELAAERIAVSDVLVGRTETAFQHARLGQAGYAARAPRLPVMTAGYVAARLLAIAGQPRGRTHTLRLLDRLIVLGNVLVPDFIARRAMKSYRTDER